MISLAVQIAVARGWLDVPFSPSRYNAGKALPVRDRTGAVRFAHVGDIPFPSSVVAQHEHLVAERYAVDGTHLDELIDQDISVTARGNFDTWPLG